MVFQILRSAARSSGVVTVRRLVDLSGCLRQRSATFLSKSLRLFKWAALHKAKALRKIVWMWRSQPALRGRFLHGHFRLIICEGCREELYFAPEGSARLGFEDLLVLLLAEAILPWNPFQSCLETLVKQGLSKRIESMESWSSSSPG